VAYLPILTYHRLLADEPTRERDPKRISVSAARFRSHMQWLKRLGYRSVRLDDYARDLRQGCAPRGRCVGISFDDGYVEVLRLGLPILREVGFTATIFGVPGELGGKNAWDDGRAALMSADEFRAWDAAGMTVGAHTATHARLPKVPVDQAAREISESKRLLEDVLQKPVTTFAYPYGERNAEVVRLVEAAGFEAAYATDQAPAAHEQNLFELRRAVVFPRNNAWEILLKSQRWYPAYQDRKRR
jgi:peptidoglycan/xylan/chitin deacetylase (PgdA/CDA1 family)